MKARAAKSQSSVELCKVRVFLDMAILTQTEDCQLWWTKHKVPISTRKTIKQVTATRRSRRSKNNKIHHLSVKLSCERWNCTWMRALKRSKKYWFEVLRRSTATERSYNSVKCLMVWQLFAAQSSSQFLQHSGFRFSRLPIPTPKVCIVLVLMTQGLCHWMSRPLSAFDATSGQDCVACKRGPKLKPQFVRNMNDWRLIQAIATFGSLISSRHVGSPERNMFPSVV